MSDVFDTADLPPLDSGRRVKAVVGLVLLILSPSAQPAGPSQLPIPCATGSCGPTGPSVWVASGSATASQSANSLTINQQSNQAIFNWATFDIGEDASVTFKQPSATAVALNRIFQSDPTHIFGNLTANGQIYLINQNGIIFGPHSKVNVNSLIASTLTISDTTFKNGILSPDLLLNDNPAFSAALDVNGNPVSGSVIVDAGAQISTTKSGNGRIVLLGQDVDNSGTLSSPNGQVILAAGQKAYFQASDDVKLRGLVVEVDGGGTVWNRLAGSIASSTGNVTLLGLAVNQDGRVSATTSVSANGSISLRAEDTHNVTFVSNSTGGVYDLGATHGGTLELGAGSVTSVLPDTVIQDTAVNAQVQNPSTIDLVGRSVHLAGGSDVIAKGGQISVLATQNSFAAGSESVVPVDPGSQLRIDSGAVLDASGSDAVLPMSDNIVAVQLRGNELRDSPQQRNGALRGKTVYVDARVGTTIGDVQGAIDAIPHTIQERTSAGGTILVKSEGDAVLAQGSTLDVSGGKISYTGGVIATTQLVTSDGRVVDIGTADPNISYSGLINPTLDVTHFKWGVVQNFALQGTAHYEAGYDQGQNAGTVQIAGRSLVVNGTLTGNAYSGPYQRDAAHRPLGGLLIIGDPNDAKTDYFAPSVDFRTGILPIDVAPGTPLTGLLSTLSLPTDYLLTGGFTRTQVYSNGRIYVPADTPLDLPAFSTVLFRAPRIEMYSDFLSPGGSLSLTSVSGVDTSLLSYTNRAGIQIGPGVRFDVSGQWINDYPAVAGVDPVNPLAYNGGSIAATVSADSGELVIGSGSHVDVSAGAYVDSNGSLNVGSAGGITFAASGARTAVDFGAGLDLSGYGINGGKGGSLRIVANRIEIEHSPLAWPARRVDFSDPSARSLLLSDSVFSSGGFSSFTIGANGPATTDPVIGTVQPFLIDGSASIHPQILTRFLPSDALYSTASGTPIASLSAASLPYDYQKVPATLTFSAYALGVGSTVDVTTANAGDLVVQPGAVIQADAGSSINFASATNLRFSGTAIAPAGSISMTLENPSARFDNGYDPKQGIYLESGSVLNAGGTVVMTPSTAGLRTGQVLDGGSVTLTADRGSVFGLSGSSINVSGVDAVLDIANSNSSSGFVATPVASAGGSIAMTAPESIVLDSTLSGTAGNYSGAAGPAGGSLSLTLSRFNGYVPPQPDTPVPPVPTSPRTILLTNSSQPQSVDVTTVNPLSIRDAGFDAFTVAADDLIELAAGTPLSFDRSISLQAPNIGVFGSGAVSVHAPVVTLGSISGAAQTLIPSVGGPSTLNVSADLLELDGNISLLGFGQTKLTGTEGIRAAGVLNGQQLTGSLTASGDLQLTAREIYPTTLSQFTINVPDGTIETFAVGAPQPVLSAGGSLTLSANKINHGGSIEAPFGQINLNGSESVVLRSGSLLSTSGAGQTIPFGQTQNGSAWIYALNDALQVPVLAPPGKKIGLTAPDVDVAAGSTVDISGGGDLYAYEFTPGLGGSKDTLSAAVSPTSFAIIPLSNGYAPYDTQYYAGSGIKAGDAVYLSGIPGELAAGTYAIMPARYALLPGAFLITPVNGQQDLSAGQTASASDGSPIISGYRTTLNTELRDSRASGFIVRPGSYAHQLAQYDDSFANAFFAAAAKTAGIVPPPLPADAGALALSVVDQLTLAGDIKSQAATGARGAVVDLTAQNLEIVSQVPGAGGATGVVQVSASSLQALGAQSLLIGGTRTTAADGSTQLTIAAQDVSLASGVTLAAPEVLLVGQNSVSVGDGAHLTASGASTGLGGGNVTVASSTGTSALLRVSTGNQIDIVRTTTDASAGAIDIGSGAVITAPGAITLSATRDATSKGTLEAGHGSVSLEASLIALGDEAGSTQGLVLSNAQLASLGSVSDLRLISQSTIDVYGGATLGSRDSAGKASLGVLSLNAAGIRGFGANADTLNIAATDLHLGNTGSGVAAGPGSGTGMLSIDSDTLSLDAGSYEFSGFKSVTLGSRGDIVASGRSSIVSLADLNLRSARILGAGGADLSLDASGHAVRMVATPSVASSTATTPGLGVRFAITADSISQGGDVELPSGQLSLTSQSDLTVGAGSTIDVAGVTRSIGGVPVSTPGGTVTLTSTAGNVNLAAGSSVDLSGAGPRAAGTLAIDAAGTAQVLGTLHATSADDANGGSFLLRTGTLADLSALAGTVTAAGFTGRQDYRVDSGDVALNAGAAIRAHEVSVSADGGALSINGTIDGHGTTGGTVLLAARNDLTLGGTGLIRTDASGSSSTGGSVEFDTASGSLSTAAGSKISAAGPDGGGTVTFRAPIAGNDIAISALDGSITGANALVVRAVRSYDNVAVVDGTVQATVANDLADFGTTAAAVSARLGRAGIPPLLVEAGVELRNAGDMAVSTPWDFATLQPNGLPGELTLRAGGTLTIGANLSDGFVDTGAGIVQTDTPSWSYRLAGGADLNAANPSATVRARESGDQSGKLVLGSGATVRTGTGSIAMNAATDLVFTDQTSVIYTSGTPVAGQTPFVSTIGTFNFDNGGGDIRLNAGRDVVGAVTTQMITDWQLRSGADPRVAGSRTQWGTDFSKFQQNVGALGGGNLTVTAGRDVINLSAVVPTTGFADTASNTVSVYGGGNLSVIAGRDLSSGLFYIGRGAGNIEVGRSMNAAGRSINGIPFGTVLALGDGSFQVVAGNELDLQSVLNPTVIGQALPSSSRLRSYFLTYSNSSSVDLQSLSGALSLLNNHQTFGGSVSALVNNNTPNTTPGADAWYPGRVSAAALDGDINVGGPMWLFPSTTGNLDLLAQDNVNLTVGQVVSAIYESGTLASQLPSPFQPSTAPQGTANSTLQPLGFQNTLLHQNDTTPVRIVAATGDINGGQLRLVEPARLIAGNDIIGVDLVAQNFNASDITLLQAGRDITYASSGNTGQITVAGPGYLDVLAGRNVDLATSIGISTIGATVNTFLPNTSGASVNLMAGLGKTPDYQDFIQTYLIKSDTYASNLTDYMRLLTGNATLSAKDAVSAFLKLPTEQQLPVIFKAFFEELKLAGREANEKKKPGYARGFTAINTLFPGSVKPDGTSVGAADLPYKGDLELAFSRIYTLSGGDINLLVPGGLINVGLAVAPADAPNRSPSQLGIVTQGPGSVDAFTYGDVLVNQSRVFTLDGGSIIIWSSTGNIDAGRGAKTSISAPPPLLIVKADGSVSVDFAGAVAGSGIRTILTQPGVVPGDVDLIAPVGTVNAGDAGIGSAGNINIAAQTVVGADNINFGGTATGVPATTSNLAAGLTGVSNTASNSSSNAAAGAAGAGAAEKNASIADAALSWLDVFVTGLGEENCKQDDMECLKRQKHN